MENLRWNINLLGVESSVTSRKTEAVLRDNDVLKSETDNIAFIVGITVAASVALFAIFKCFSTSVKASDISSFEDDPTYVHTVSMDSAYENGDSDRLDDIVSVDSENKDGLHAIVVANESSEEMVEKN